MTLNDIKIGKSAVVTAVGGEGALRQHFLDMGVIPGAEVTVVKYAPMGDPMELRIHGYELTLRLADAEKIQVKAIAEPTDPSLTEAKTRKPKMEHPGLGEGGRFHEKATEHPLPKDTKLTFALAGNQNCGKTTLFNQLTGANQHVGNFPGVTVDQKSGPIKGHPNTLVTGFMAKESVVSTLNVLFGTTAALQAVLSPATAAALLVFCLLYTPCVAAIASVKQELGGKWAVGVVFEQYAIAWICAAIVKVIAAVFGII